MIRAVIDGRRAYFGCKTIAGKLSVPEGKPRLRKRETGDKAS